jgi:cationic peptide transport system ATP-binding protein
MTALLEVQALQKSYLRNVSMFKREAVHALMPLTFDLKAGETLAVIGEAGAGKSTLGRLLAGAEEPTAGQILLDGQQLNQSNAKFRCSKIRLIFQDPKKSLNPNVKIGRILSAPLTFNTQKTVKQRMEKIRETLLKVGMLPEHIEYYPHMLSTGQLQRVSLARALILDPQILVLDEAVASLDPSVRAQIVNLLLELQESQNLSYVLITHHLGIVKHISDQVLVLKAGSMLEYGSTADVFINPQEKYTEKLLASQDF